MRTKTPGRVRRPGHGGTPRREPEGHYRLMFESNPHPMWVYDLETLAFLAVNEAAIYRYGYTRDEFLAMTIKDIRPPEDVPALLRTVARVSDGLDDVGVWRHRKKDGSIIDVEITSHALRFAGRRARLILAQDVTARRRAEEALRQSEDRYRMLFDLESDAVFMIDNESGRLLEANAGAAALYGYTREELLAMKNIDLSAEPEDTRRVTTETPIAPDRIVRIPLRYHRRKGGTVFPAEITGRFFEWYGRKVHIAAVRDITDRKRAEAEIQELARFPGENPNPVLRINQDGVISYANRASACLLNAWGTQQGQALPEHWRNLTLTALRTGSSQVIEVEVGGRTLSLAFAPVGAAGYVNVYGFDITDRKRAEAALSESEQRFRMLAEAPFEGIALIEQGVFTDLSDQLASMLGYSRGELIGKPVMQVVAPEWRERVAEAIQTGRLQPYEHLTMRKDGTVFPVEVRAKMAEIGGRQVRISAVRDISERKRAEEEQQRLEEKMWHVQKLQSLGVLAGGIAHDFNNLLAAIQGNTDLALLFLPPAAPARQHVKEIGNAVQRAAELCRQMLAYSGKGRFVVQRHDLAAIVREMASMLEVSISKKAVLRYYFAAALPAIEADATQLRQVVMNLITNASEALGEAGGVISVTTGVRECDRAYLEESALGQDRPEGQYVYLEVADTGCGMDAETRQRIFDPFFTTKFTGRGLGLAAVLGIVRGHQGAIRVSSKPGEGSTFTVLFPAAAGEAAPAGVTPEATAAWRGSGTVLLVDDEEAVRNVVKEMLECLGLEVVTAADGREALAEFRAHVDAIVCVLLDLTMPRMSGEETFRELRRLRTDLRIILSSGYNEQDVIQQFAGKGLAGFIQKPYTLGSLQEAMRRALG